MVKKRWQGFLVNCVARSEDGNRDGLGRARV